jgi:hypothetical protein
VWNRPHVKLVGLPNGVFEDLVVYISRKMIAPTLLLMLAACSGSDSKDGVDPSNLTATASMFRVPALISVAPSSVTVAIGAKTTLSSVIKDASGQLLPGLRSSWAEWYSSDTTIAKVGMTSGVVTGVHSGVVTITAVAGLASAKSNVTVNGTSSPTPLPPTPTPPTPVPPTPTPPSSGTGLSGLGLISDDFTKYSSTAAFLANVTSNIGGTGGLGSLYGDGANANLAQIDPSVQYNGHAALKYNQPGGVSNTPELWVRLPQSLSVMWLRAKIRFSPGFTTTGTLGNSANAYKMLGWAWDTYDGSGRVEIANTSQYQLYWTALAKSTGAVVGGGVYGMGGSVNTEWTDGGWYDYIVEVDFSKNPGVARLWMAKDGQTPVLRATSSSNMQGSAALPKLTNVNWGMNFNQVRAAGQTQALWYGQWEVVDGVAHPDPYKLGVQ